ncbi:MAG: tetratricopeptide repeat protein [Candidatus Omnitrophica bacterium]|nr:tetratricopeptide repeat protein [Candidatus Omnitrophota bacterium]
MNRILKTIFQSLIGTVLLFISLEGAFYLVGAPSGASRFAESVIIREHLSPKKSKDEFRIFTYGESTMYGAHYGAVSSPARWLEIYLKDFLPNQKIDVVNFARLGCGSYFIYNTFKQTLAYKPDLAIFYLGHNGFLPGNRKDEVKLEESTFGAYLRRLIQKSRFFSAVYRSWIKLSIQFKTGSNKESDLNAIETEPSTFKPEDVITKDNPVYWENIEFSKQNIWRILELAKENGIHVLFLKPVCNLKDFSPNHSVHTKELTKRELVEWEKWYANGKFEQNEGHTVNALEFYRKAYAVDPTYADLAFRLGETYFQLGDYRTARRYFEEARDHDAVINRATDDVLKIFEEFQKTEDLQLIDTKKILAEEAKEGILGEPVIEDNVHFSLKGHFLVGRALANEMAGRNWIAPKEQWRFERERSHEEIANQMGINQDLLISAYLKSIVYFGSRLENRIRFAQKVLELDPKNSEALRHLAWAYWLNGQYAQALEIYKELERVDPDSLSEVFKLRPKIKKAYRNVRMPPTPISIY